MNKLTRTALAVGALAIAASSLSACGAPDDSAEGDGKVTLTVGDMPTSANEEARTLFLDQVEGFEKANPDITIEASETVYDPNTFQALLAGGTLPDVMNVSSTEGHTIGGTGQVADLTDLLADTGLDKELNETVLAMGEDADGRIFALPTDGTVMGLAYNRDLFEAAGLDPDEPPTTWEELRADAKKIKDATGVDGFAHYGSNNQGGWQFETELYSFGGRLVNEDNTEASLTETDAAADLLQLISDMRHEDGSIGTNTVYSFDDAAKDFAAGKFAMMVIFSQAAWGGLVVTNGFPAESLGMGGVPQNGDEPLGTASGAGMTVISAKATDAEQKAAMKWIQWRYLNKYTDEILAVADAEATAAAGNPVGLPTLPLLSEDKQAEYESWIAPYVNVPQENFAPLLATASTIPLISGPVKNTQAIYGRLDTVIQAVLSDPNADIPTLLEEAEPDIDRLLTR